MQRLRKQDVIVEPLIQVPAIFLEPLIMQKKTEIWVSKDWVLENCQKYLHDVER